jgi:hypothetical protein
LNLHWTMTPLRSLLMAHLNGHTHPLQAVFLDQLLLHNPMGRCFVQPGTCSRWQNADKSGPTRCGCRMRRGSRIAIPVPYVSTVKALAPSRPGGLVPYIGLLHPTLSRPWLPEVARLPFRYRFFGKLELGSSLATTSSLFLLTFALTVFLALQPFGRGSHLFGRHNRFRPHLGQEPTNGQIFCLQESSQEN